MHRPRRSILALAAVVALLTAACGGGDDDTSSAPSVENEGAEQADQEPPTDGGEDEGGAEDAGGDDDDPADSDADGSPQPAGGDFEVPIALYAAHGAEDPNTIAPTCGVGNLDRGGDLFRFTAPAGFTWKSSSGGSGRDEIGIVDADDVSLLFTEAVNPSELSLVTEYAVIGPSGTEVTINDESIPVMEVTVEGSTAYALVDLPYLTPLPLLPDGGALGTAIVSSSTEGHPTIDEATAILETVRVERCAAIAQAMIWSAAGGFAPVPRFEPDPLGKTWPNEPQPAIAGLPTLDVYSTEQLAYLLPVEEDRSICAAEAVQAAWADNPLGSLLALTPSGTQHDDLEAVIADC